MGMAQDGQSINPEGLINLNAFMIMTICFLVAGFSARLKATNSMALGTFLACAALLLFGKFNFAWIIVAAIIIFSLGEMLSSPKSSEYLGNIAPAQKKAMYLGFSQLPIGIGWIAESYMGPFLYGTYSSKENISRELLRADGVEVSSIPVGEAFDQLVIHTGQTAEALTAQLYSSNDIGMVWYVMATVGLISAFGMYVYGVWTYRVATRMEASPQPAT
jgi:hypothetical protein